MAAALSSEATSIFDILNLYIRGAYPPPNPDKSHRYYLCKESQGIAPVQCQQVSYKKVIEFHHAKETKPTKDIIVPIEQSSPKFLDAPILGSKLWAPVTIVPHN
jgi:hypothetical protein